MDETTGTIFLFTRAAIVIKMSASGAIEAETDLAINACNSLDFSADKSELIIVGGETHAIIAVLSTIDLSVLHFVQYTAQSDLHSVTSNGVDSWYSVGWVQ